VPRGITVNTIQSGPVATDTNPDSGEFADAVRSATAVGHFGQPHDIADAVGFLARTEARFVTGTTWNIDGAWALWASTPPNSLSRGLITSTDSPAQQVYDEVGPDGWRTYNVARIAAEFGVSRLTIVRHIDNLPNLALSVP
jgi:hypothetical protein